MQIISFHKENYPEIKQIYLDGIASGHATFQTEAPEWMQWDEDHLEHSRLAVVENSIITGWAALTPVSGRCVYAGLAELSVYVHKDHRGKGIGNLLLQELINTSEANTIWTLQAGIFPENKASLALHYKNGFRQVGIREKVGKMGNVWRNVVLMERRSKVAGCD
jgi:L-amino acid N-acyltransferase YncA